MLSCGAVLIGCKRTGSWPARGILTVSQSIPSSAPPPVLGGVDAPGSTFELLGSVPGLSLNATTGVLAGTPLASAQGTVTLQLRATDADGDTSTLSEPFNLTVYPKLEAVLATPWMNVTQMYTLKTGVTVINATGGRPPLRLALGNEQLPSGLNLQPLLGRIAGQPTAPPDVYSGTFENG